MYWAETGAPGGIRHDPDSTRWCLCIYEAPLPKPAGSSITLSPYRRPTAECAPVDAKAGCLYPNNARAIIEAQPRGFDNCLMRDMLGHVAELGTANVFMAKDGIVYTPAANGTYLNGITRQRVIKLLRDEGTIVVEKSLSYAEFQSADEIFSSGNYSKLSPVTRIDDRAIATGPVVPQGARTLLGVCARLSGPTRLRDQNETMWPSWPGLSRPPRLTDEERTPGSRLRNRGGFETWSNITSTTCR